MVRSDRAGSSPAWATNNYNYERFSIYGWRSFGNATSSISCIKTL